MSQQPLFDVAKVEHQLDEMELEAVMKALLQVRTTQRISSKKRAAKRAALRDVKPKKVKLTVKAMTQLALGTASPVAGYGSLYDYILAEADKRADMHLSKEQKDSLSPTAKGTPS